LAASVANEIAPTKYANSGPPETHDFGQAGMKYRIVSMA
jgi:hypothetical protein